MRADLDIIRNWIAPGSRVLDLGCGDGSLLRYLQDNLQTVGTGLEIDETRINACLAKGISVIQQDLNKGLQNFESQSFDTILLTQTLQTVDGGAGKPDPRMVLDAMAETGARAEETVVIGDTSFDMKMARAANAHALGVSWGFHTADEIAEGGAHAVHHAFDDLNAWLDAFEPRSATGDAP
jgi:methionine biosynthesis protein MetW